MAKEREFTCAQLQKPPFTVDELVEMATLIENAQGEGREPTRDGSKITKSTHFSFLTADGSKVDSYFGRRRHQGRRPHEYRKVRGDRNLGRDSMARRYARADLIFISRHVPTCQFVVDSIASNEGFCLISR